MIKQFALLRGIAWLKRLALAAESSARSLETLARISQDDWESKHAPRPRGKFIIGRLDQQAANEHWREIMGIEDDGA